MRIVQILRRWRASARERAFNSADYLLRIELSRAAIDENIATFRRLFPRHELGVVMKSNAYGHGLIEMGRYLDRCDGVGRLVVDNIVEARVLRDVGVRKMLLIMGYVPATQVASVAGLGRVAMVVNNFEQARMMARTFGARAGGRRLDVHVKVDTGMHRYGVVMEELVATIDVLCGNPSLRVCGLMSHLADADNAKGNTEATMRQLAAWREAIAVYRATLARIASLSGVAGDDDVVHAFHIGASSGTPFMYGVSEDCPVESNLLRIGISTYGIDVTANRMLGVRDGVLGVRPVLSLWAKIIGLKRLRAGDCVGYGFTFQAAAPMTVAVLPLGYYEALPRRLSNIGCVQIHGHVCPIVGRVSMNLTVVDVTPIADQLALEDDVEVLSADPMQPNSVEHVARACDTIPYEILVKLAAGIKRVFI